VRLLLNDVTRDFDEVVEYERESLERRGGTLIVERAARPVTHAFGRVEGISLMAGVKRVFDPAGILAPEAFVA
jgi:FAD/FMN-containing dehydrogenase